MCIRDSICDARTAKTKTKAESLSASYRDSIDASAAMFVALGVSSGSGCYRCNVFYELFIILSVGNVCKMSRGRAEFFCVFFQHARTTATKTLTRVPGDTKSYLLYLLCYLVICGVQYIRIIYDE